MPELKLPRLPDRSPVKITIMAPPDLARALTQYAEAYRAVYGKEEPVAELIPYMLDSFLKSDRSYLKVAPTAAG